VARHSANGTPVLQGLRPLGTRRYRPLAPLWYNSLERETWKERQVAMSSVKTVTIPEVELTLDQLVTAIRQLEPAARSEIARALVWKQRWMRAWRADQEPEQ